jgi:hypothetical protein
MSRPWSPRSCTTRWKTPRLTPEAITTEFGATVTDLVDGSPSWTSCSSATARKPTRKASARCCWRCRVICA